MLNVRSLLSPIIFGSLIASYGFSAMAAEGENEFENFQKAVANVKTINSRKSHLFWEMMGTFQNVNTSERKTKIDQALGAAKDQLQKEQLLAQAKIAQTEAKRILNRIKENQKRFFQLDIFPKGGAAPVEMQIELVELSRLMGTDVRQTMLFVKGLEDSVQEEMRQRGLRLQTREEFQSNVKVKLPLLRTKVADTLGAGLPSSDSIDFAINSGINRCGLNRPIYIDVTDEEDPRYKSGQNNNVTVGVAYYGFWDLKTIKEIKEAAGTGVFGSGFTTEKDSSGIYRGRKSVGTVALSAKNPDLRAYLRALVSMIQLAKFDISTLNK